MPIGDAKILRWCLPGIRVWRLSVCKLRLGCQWEIREFCVDVFLACGFGALVCVNCVPGSCANRRREIFVPESDCEGFLLKISSGIRFLIIIISSSSSSSSSHHHHHLPLSLSLALLFFSILAQRSRSKKHARATPLRESACRGPKSVKN